MQNAEMSRKLQELESKTVRTRYMPTIPRQGSTAATSSRSRYKKATSVLLPDADDSEEPPSGNVPSGGPKNDTVITHLKQCATLACINKGPFCEFRVHPQQGERSVSIADIVHAAGAEITDAGAPHLLGNVVILSCRQGRVQTAD